MICSKSVAVLLLAVLVLVAVREGRSGSVRWPRIRPLNLDSSLPELSAYRETPEHSTVEEIIDELQLRSRRQAGSGTPTPHGDYLFAGDGNQYARIYYSGSPSPVILVLTYNNRDDPTRTNLYRSANYGASFQNINAQLGSPLWSNFHSSTTSNLVVLSHSTQPTIYISQDEGATWITRQLSPGTIDPRSLVWNPRQENSAIAHDTVNRNIYVTEDLGQSWIKIAGNVNNPSDYQWGNNYDNDSSVIYYNSFDPRDANRGDFTVGLYSQRSPYTDATQREVDPNLGRHDDFFLVGPYIFAQRNDSGRVHLYISYLRQPFNRARIPSTDPHQSYYVTHINELQALVIVEHASGKYNLYLSDITGEYFSLSLEDLVVVGNRRTIDLEVIDGINGTMIANRKEPANGAAKVVRTVVTLDNGGEWNYITPPETDLSGAPILCEPPSCSLHFHMASSEYARLGVYSQDSAPGIIVAHGTIGSQLGKNPDLYISRDGGVSWAQTLNGSYGVTVVDHGGLLVAADDYHKEPSSALLYSCDEGLSWSSYTYSQTDMTVYGIITEPGEETTTVSLYGIRVNTRAWDVVTVNFSSIFSRTCTASDFYQWQPWDARTESDCILGLDVTLERRLPEQCCLIGLNYDRPITTRICQCTIDDYECDYGFKPADGFNGPCVRDEAVPLDDPCADGQVKTVMKSRGYRKVAGDICTSDGSLVDFDPYEFTCCNATIVTIHGDTVTDSGLINIGESQSTVVGLGVALGFAILVALALGIVVASFMWRHSKLRVRYSRLLGSESGVVQFRSFTTNNSSGDSEQLLGGDNVDDDDPPLNI